MHKLRQLLLLPKQLNAEDNFLREVFFVNIPTRDIVSPKRLIVLELLVDCCHFYIQRPQTRYIDCGCRCFYMLGELNHSVIIVRAHSLEKTTEGNHSALQKIYRKP